MANGKWQMELVHEIWDFASGRLGIKHCLAGICVCSWVKSLQGSVDGIQDFTSGHRGSTHCLALKRVCSFRSIHYGVYGIQDFTSGLPGSTQYLALKRVCSFRSIHYGVWFMGFRILPLGVRGSTLFGNEVRMHCQLNSLQDRFTGFGSCLWASGKQTLLCIEMHTRLGLKCVCSFSGQPSATHFGHRFLVLGLDQVRTARLSRGSQITIRHPGDHTMLSYNYLCSWFMHLVQFWCGSSLHSKAVMWRTNCHKASGMNQCNPLT